MHKAAHWQVAWLVAGIWFAAIAAPAQTSFGVDPTDKPGQDLTAGWSLVQEGEAIGTVEVDAKRSADSDEKLLHLAVTKTATPGKGRVGAINHTPIAVQEGQWYDVTFRAIAEGRSIGIVFSLETTDGNVLARTTLPEIGRGRGGRGVDPAEANPAGRKYTVALHARGSDAKGRLVMTPIEPTNLWIGNVTIAPRSTAP